jgi:hypothetical protein
VQARSRKWSKQRANAPDPETAAGCRWNKLVSLHINEPTGARRTTGPSLHCSPLVGHGAQSVAWAAAGKTENNNTINGEFRTIVASA